MRRGRADRPPSEGPLLASNDMDDIAGGPPAPAGGTGAEGSGDGLPAGAPLPPPPPGPPGGADPRPPRLNTQACFRHPNILTGVHCTRCGKPICTECMRPAAVGYQCPDDYAAEQRSGGRAQPGVAPRRRSIPVTQTLMGLNVIAFVAEIATG